MFWMGFLDFWKIFKWENSKKVNCNERYKEVREPKWVRERRREENYVYRYNAISYKLTKQMLRKKFWNVPQLCFNYHNHLHQTTFLTSLQHFNDYIENKWSRYVEKMEEFNIYLPPGCLFVKQFPHLTWASKVIAVTRGCLSRMFI